MAMRRESDVQTDLMVTWAEMPRSPGHAFYDKLQAVLTEAGFDGFVEDICKPYYAPRMGAPSLPPGRYFRMHMVGYFEGIDSERGIVWRCSDSYSLRDFLRLANRDKVPDHSWLSKTRSRLPHEVHDKVFGWVLALVAVHVAGFNLAILMRALFRIRDSERGRERQKRAFVRHSDRNRVGHRHDRRYRRRTGHARHRRLTRRGLIRDRLHHRTVKGPCSGIFHHRFCVVGTCLL
jgi:hypothetical protein